MSDTPIVTVEQGRLQGRLLPSPSGKSFYSFQGIPYAKPPLGSLRFKAPQPVEPWEGVREAMAEGNVSAQIDPLIHKEYIGDENCLFLNVYTPNLDGEFLPVMIFIHGGGFQFGSGNTSTYGADYLVEKDVVIVTINYRCGPLGFLCLNTPDVPGNAGLKDMAQAIKWVKDNIKHFGGNAANMTVFGESAGGVAVGLLTASPLTKELLSKAIIQSGSALSSWGIQKDPLKNARELAKYLGCESEGVDDILEFLSSTPVRELVEAAAKLNPLENFLEKGSISFVPVVEKEFPDVEPALTESFIDLLTSGRVAQIPVMIGSTTLEFTPPKPVDDIRTLIPEDFNIDKDSDDAVAIADAIKRLYFKNGQPTVENLTEYSQLVSDKVINIDTHRYVKYLVQVSNKPIYYYKFDYVGGLNVGSQLMGAPGLKHAAHMDELGYLFKNILQNDVEPTPQDIKMRERMVRLWTNFAKGGNPTPDENHYITVTWQPVTEDKLYYLNLCTELTLSTNPEQDKMEFWEYLYNRHYKNWEHQQIVEVPKEENKVETKVQEISEQLVESFSVTVRETSEVRVQNSEIRIESSEVQVVTSEVEAVTPEPKVATPEPKVATPEPKVATPEPKVATPEVEVVSVAVKTEPLDIKEKIEVPKLEIVSVAEEIKRQNGNVELNGKAEKEEVVIKPRTSNEIKMVVQSNGVPKDVIRANDPPEDDLPKNIGVNKFVNFFESLGGKK